LAFFKDLSPSAYILRTFSACLAFIDQFEWRNGVFGPSETEKLDSFSAGSLWVTAFCDRSL